MLTSSSMASARSMIAFFVLDALGMHAEGPVALGKASGSACFPARQIAEDLGRLEHAADAHLVDLVNGVRPAPTGPRT
jgi:hypothetical protein